jgi:hypothetical protein
LGSFKPRDDVEEKPCRLESSRRVFYVLEVRVKGEINCWCVDGNLSWE